MWVEPITEPPFNTLGRSGQQSAAAGFCGGGSEDYTALGGFFFFLRATTTAGSDSTAIFREPFLSNHEHVGPGTAMGGFNPIVLLWK